MRKISVKFAAAQIKKLGSLPGFPRDIPEAQTALVDVLIKRAICEEHAETAIASILDGDQYSPTPARIADAVRETAAPYQAPEVSHCGSCIEGWRPVVFLVRVKHGAPSHRWRITRDQAVELLDTQQCGPNETIVEAVEPCSCAAGRIKLRAAA